MTFLLTPGSTDNAGRSTTTNSLGEYRFEDVYTSNSNLQVTAPGYGETRTGLHVSGPTLLNFQLRRIQ